MTLITAEQIAQKILAGCKEDFASLQRAGIPSKVLAGMVALNATDYLKWMSNETKQAFQQSRKDVKKLARKLEKSANDAVTLPGVREALQLQAQSLRDRSVRLGNYLRSNRQRNGTDMLLLGILKYNPKFNSWSALSRVLEAAFVAEGTDATHRLDDLSPDMLRKTAERFIVQGE